MQLKDLISGDFPIIEESKHRTKDEIKRPIAEVQLLSLAKESRNHAKTQNDPTDDLIEVYSGPFVFCLDSAYTECYCIFCKDTLQMWVAPTKLCLDANFVYRDDLIIQQVYSLDEVKEFFNTYLGDVAPKILTRKTCYIMDLPGNETYEVYYDSNYPSLTYGKATPVGSLIHKYPNRFHRDMAILALDELYSNSSNKVAGKLTAKEFAQNEAIVVSDGAWMREVTSSSCYYLDAESVIHLTEGRLPSDSNQAVLIAEIKAAYNALGMCYARGKKKVTYYYDNTSILNIFRNRKMEYLEEIKAYKDLCEKMLLDGYSINFVEIHPKTGEDRDETNKALMFFHNRCDDDCRDMCDLVKKDYKSFTQSGSKEGKTYKEVKEEFKPKGKPRQGQGGQKKSIVINRGNMGQRR